MEETPVKRMSVKQSKEVNSAYWKPVLNHFKADVQKQYCPHKIYPRDKDMHERFAKLYREEVKIGKDLFLESCDGDRNVETERDGKRILLRVSYDPSWSKLNLSPGEYFEISLRDAEVIDNPNMFAKPAPTAPVNSKYTEQQNLFPESDIDETSISDMTIKDFAAIMWMRPVSDRQGLNDLIKKTFKLK